MKKKPKDDVRNILPKDIEPLYGLWKIFEEPKQSTKERIISETSEETKQKARDYGNSLVNKQETLEESAEKQHTYEGYKAFINGAKWQQEQDKKMYSEEDMKFAYEQGARLALISQSSLALQKGEFPTPKEWFEQFSK